MPTDETNQIQADGGQIYLIAGNSLRKLLDTIKANKPLPGSNITLAESSDGIIINATSTTSIPAPPTSGTWFLGAIDGIIQWIDSTTCS